MITIPLQYPRELKDSRDLKGPQALQAPQAVETTTVSAVTLGTLVILDPVDLLETKGSRELKVVQGFVNVSLAGGAQGLMVHLVIQARQDYLELKDQEGTQV